MPTVSLNAFLKILSKGSPQKAAEYGRYLTPGGYDFYWMLKEAARALTVGGKPLVECSKAISEINRAVEKKHNLNALNSLDKWIKKNQIDEFFEIPISICMSPAGHLTIKLEPAFGCVRNGQRLILHAWNSQSISLSKNVASCGLFLIQQHLCTNGYADCSPAILDLRRRELFSAKALPPMVGPMVASELAWADIFFAGVAASKAA
jgi:hypothetical protein